MDITNPLENTSPGEIRAAFHLKNLTQKEWAEANGFSLSLVRNIISTYPGTGRTPVGVQTSAIINALAAFVGDTQPLKKAV